MDDAHSKNFVSESRASTSWFRNWMMDYCCSQIIWTHLRQRTPFKVVNQVHAIYTLKFPRHMILAPMWASFRSKLATKGALSTGSGNNNNDQLAFSLGGLRWMYPNYEISPVKNTYQNLLEILSVVILHRQFRSAVFRTKFMLDHYFSVKVLIGTWYMNRFVNSTGWIDLQKKITKGKISFLVNDSIAPTVKE